LRLQTVVIRPYQPSDQSSVAGLWRVVFPDDPPWNAPASVIRRKVAFQPELLVVGELEGRVVATIVIGFDGFRCTWRRE
jgi:hypothetical protein